MKKLKMIMSIISVGVLLVGCNVNDEYLNEVAQEANLESSKAPSVQEESVEKEQDIDIPEDSNEEDTNEVAEEINLESPKAPPTEEELEEQIPVEQEVADKDQDISTPEDEDREIYEIHERMFLTQSMDIYMNPDDYTDKTIKLEGIYEHYKFEYEETEEEYDVVMRYAPGCCGDDGFIGFELLYDGERPEPNDWIEVIGVVEIIEGEYWDTVVIRAEQITVLDERGAEFVMF